MPQNVTLTASNVEYASLFVLNCDVSLFNVDISADQLKHKRNLLNEKYRLYAKLLLRCVDMERNEKITQLKNAMDSMIVPATDLVACLTERALRQLSHHLNKETKLTTKKADESKSVLIKKKLPRIEFS